jgi:hypothetical protein
MVVYIPRHYSEEEVRRGLDSGDWIEETAVIDSSSFGIAGQCWDNPGFQCLQLGINFDGGKKQEVFYIKSIEDVNYLLEMTNSASFENLNGHRIAVYSDNNPRERLSSVARCISPILNN